MGNALGPRPQALGKPAAHDVSEEPDHPGPCLLPAWDRWPCPTPDTLTLGRTPPGDRGLSVFSLLCPRPCA